MSAVFLKLVNLSITASWLTLAVLLVRLMLKKAPKWISCLLWALVAVRLVCPFSIESALSLIPSGETVPGNIETMHSPAIDSGVAVINAAVNPVLAGSFTPSPSDSVNPLQILVPMLTTVWIAGMAALLLYAFVSSLRLKRSVGVSVSIGARVFACDEVQSPFIFGIVKPTIYVPSSLKGETLSHVLAHETAHLKRRDHWWKPLGYLLLTVYWFNPVLWLAYILLCRDIELACDERVIREMSREDKASYSQALLDCSMPRRVVAACPLAFGEVGVKERVKSVLNYKKPAFWLVLLAIVLCVAVAVCFLTNPAARFAVPVDSVEKAVVFHAQIDDGAAKALNPAQIERMTEAFSAVRHARRSEKYAGLTPGYGLCAFLADGGFLYANGYRFDADAVEVIYREKRYAVEDEDFAAYLRTVCEGVDGLVGVYLCEQEGFGGSFTLTLSADRTCQYYEGALSSHAGMGRWETDGDELVLIEGEAGEERRRYFTVEGDSLVYDRERSDPFIYVNPPSGTRFSRTVYRTEEPERFYLTIGAEGVRTVEWSLGKRGGGCENADGSLFRKGECIWLEGLDGDLRGLTITACGENGEVIWTAGIPYVGDSFDRVTYLSQDGWTITNLPPDSAGIVSAEWFDGEQTFALSPEAAETLDSLLNQYRSTIFLGSAGEPNQLSTFVTLHESDGSVCTVHFSITAAIPF